MICIISLTLTNWWTTLHDTSYYHSWMPTLDTTKSTCTRGIEKQMIKHVNYKYNVMSFGLKNARATYQRTMNKVFEQEIKEMLKIYMDAHRLQQIHLKMCPAYTTVLQTIKEGCTIQIDSRVRANLCALEDNTLSQPPILSRSMIEETLNIYLNVSIEAESVVLVKESDHSIHYRKSRCDYLR